jgi:RHS repeat-associated protein
MFDAKGEKTWEAQLDIYGRVRTFVGRSLSDCPFRYQGQYQDEETGLYYNRFRYYDPSVGSYISQDPIGLLGHNPTLYGYVKDVNDMVDTFGLFSDLKPTGAGHHLFPRSIGSKLGIRDIIEGAKWYPNIPEGTASLHQELHAKLAAEGIPFHGSNR